MPAITLSYLIAQSVVNVIGILAGAFTVAVNLWDWIKGNSLNTIDHILVSLGISSACFQGAQAVHVYLLKMQREAYDDDIAFKVVNHLLTWTATCASWHIACLSIFYCVKIIDFSHPLVMWLKLRISEVVPWLLLGSLVGSLALGVPVYWILNRRLSLNSTISLMSNATVSEGGQELRFVYKVITIVLGLFAPLLLSAASNMLIIASLRRHTQQMKESASAFSQPRLEVHIAAARMLKCLVLIYVCIFVGECVDLFQIPSVLNRLLGIIFPSCVAAQSFVLIAGNTKLRQVLWKLVCVGG